MSYQTLQVSHFGCFELRDIRYSAGFTAPEHTHGECCFQVVLQGSFPERSADRQDDVFFTREGGEAYLKDFPNAEMHRLASGHFAVEDSLAHIAENMRRFYRENVKG